MSNLIKKNIFFIFLFTVSLFVSCVNKNQEKIIKGPEIYITSPIDNDSYKIGSSIEIIALVADNKNEVHDITIKIKTNDSLNNINEIFFDHIHNSVFEVDTSFIANHNTNYTVQILAKDMLGNLKSDSVTIVVLK